MIVIEFVILKHRPGFFRAIVSHGLASFLRPHPPRKLFLTRPPLFLSLSRAIPSRGREGGKEKERGKSTPMRSLADRSPCQGAVSFSGCRRGCHFVIGFFLFPTRFERRSPLAQKIPSDSWEKTWSGINSERHNWHEAMRPGTCAGKDSSLKTRSPRAPQPGSGWTLAGPG